MCQSLAGLANRAVEQGTSEIAVWLHDHGGSDSYKLSKQALEDMVSTNRGCRADWNWHVMIMVRPME